MARVTATEVREIITTALTDAQIDAFAAAATLIIDRYATQCTTAGTATLKEIERQTVAHMISGAGTQGSGQRIASRTFGNSSISYQGNSSSLDFSSSQYGQTAMMLDPCGILADFGKPRASACLL